MSDTKYYMLINKNGNPIIINSQLPVYWRLSVAIENAKKFGCSVVKVKIINVPSP